MNNAEYGKRVREREQFNRSVLRRVVGKDNKAHTMTIQRKAGAGVGNFADITKPMTGDKLVFIRTRANRAAKEAFHRCWIVGNPFAVIRKRVLG